MNTFIAIALLWAALTAPATAQRRYQPPPEPPPPTLGNLPPSRTIDLIDKDTKEVIARATISGVRIYFHNMEGKHFATIEYNKDGTRTAYDSKGQKMDSSKLPPLN